MENMGEKMAGEKETNGLTHHYSAVILSYCQGQMNSSDTNKMNSLYCDISWCSSAGRAADL
jgi:hypothetical protein